jgi:tetratricopeptide (TPR) repeat protein
MTAADRAVQTARSLDDPDLIAGAFHRLANVLLVAGRYPDTVHVATNAASLVQPDRTQAPRSLALWGGLVLTAAVAAARNGARGEAWELLGEARAAARLLDHDYADMFVIFGPTNVAIHAVQVAVELGDAQTAIERAQQVDIDRLPAELVERRGQLLLDLAEAYALSGRDADAVDTLCRAHRAAAEEVAYSTDGRRLVRTLLERERRGAAPALRGLAQDIGIAC